MHSTEVFRGDSFEILVDGNPVSHADFFSDLTTTLRLGLVAPNRIDGAGAANLLMAHVTAFYDCYRAEGGEFYAYPDYFAFQGTAPLANYGMLDISPEHKLVEAGPDPNDMLRAITDRGANILVVPDSEPVEYDPDPVALPSAQRNISRCYAYAFNGTVDRANIVIRCDASPLDDWVESAFECLEEGSELQAHASSWLEACRSGEALEQSYRRIDLDEALSKLSSGIPLAAMPA
jgi:hypothetical protein